MKGLIMYKYIMKSMNFELTTECPLGCPQCYCTLHPGKHLPKEIAMYWVNQARESGVEMLNLSGGETLCYPYLFDVISKATSYGIKVNVALSGFRFSRSVCEELIRAGVDGIFVSLNGSTASINDLSRRGFNLAVSAIDLLREVGFQKTTINWVMQESNADDFPNMIRFAEEHHVARLVVMGLKPDSQNDLSHLPSKQQMLSVAKHIREYRGSVRIQVESCFSPMLALVCNSFLLGNTNTGPEKGCIAGIESLSLNVDGLLSPCRHLNYFEKWDSLQAYWEHSEVLNKIRNAETDIREPCTGCKYGPYCRHCIAINACIKNEIYLGNQFCVLSDDK